MAVMSENQHALSASILGTLMILISTYGIFKMSDEWMVGVFGLLFIVGLCSIEWWYYRMGERNARKVC